MLRGAEASALQAVEYSLERSTEETTSCRPLASG